MSISRHVVAGGFFGWFRPSDGHRSELFGLAVSGTANRDPPRGEDQTEAHQEDDRAVAIHGDVFNANELRDALALAPGTPLTRLLFAGWQRWREGLPARLDGVFALVLREGADLLLYRDPSALASLYWGSERSGEIAFSTRMDLLVQRSTTRGRIDRRSLHEYLRFLDIAAPNTLFNDIVAVEPGRPLRWAVGGLRPVEVPAIHDRAASCLSFAEAVRGLDARLQRSVRNRVAGAPRAAAFLSGGIDSALICALAAQERRDLTAVTVGFATEPYDEAPVAARIARHLGIQHQVLRFDQDDFTGAFERFIRTLEQPMADPATLATVLAFEHCVSRFDVVLDGTGADEAVGAMPARHVRLAVQYASRLPTVLRLALASVVKKLPRLSAYAPILDFEHPADTMIRWKGFTRAEVEALCGEPVSFRHTQFYKTFDRFAPGAHYERYSALLNAMPCDRLNQASLATGLRPRFPFTELHTDRFLRQLPVEFRHMPNQPKRILRALLARYVPPAIWDVPKHGFDFPLGEFLSADDHALVRRYLGRARWGQIGLLAPDLVEDIGKRFMAGDLQLRFRVWALVVLGAWLEHHGPNSL